MYTRRNKSVAELAIFAMLGCTMFVSKLLMLALPNIHLLAMLTAAFTITYRVRALIPIYIYIMLDGLFYGFSAWWLPYLYIWLPLWACVMLLSKLKLPKKVQAALYMIACALHGLSFGLMYAPAQALMFGLSFEATIAWVMSGLPFDAIHAVSNFACASLVIPISSLLQNIRDY